MCGICGAWSRSGNVDPETIRRMTATLEHRGPDGFNQHVQGRIGLGHTRLSIIDLSERGDQPLFNEDRTVACVFNGEVYNFRALRQRLEQKGHTFRGESDGEIIPHLYEEVGEGVFEHLRGMFAIAIFDTRSQKLVLGRDRFGIKPLYYADTGEDVVFGSEIKALLPHPSVQKRVDEQALHDYFSLLYVPSPATAFRDIREVAPGARHIWRLDSPSGAQEAFWSIEDYRRQTPFRDVSVERVGEVFDESVRSQLVSDVPLGAFLSGGIDSSLVVESASRALKGNGHGLPAFTVGFPDPKYDETSAAKEVAEACEVRHEILRLKDGESEPDLVYAVLKHFDQPFADSSAIPTYLISREIRKHVKVALSGDGGDELFGGYERFFRTPILRRLGAAPAPLRWLLSVAGSALAGISPDRSRQLRKALKMSSGNLGQLFGGLASYLDEDEKRALYVPGLYAQSASMMAPIARLYDEHAYGDPDDDNYLSALLTDSLLRISLHGDMLRKVDMMSMKAGLEVRVPFLDEALADEALALPHAAKVKGRVGKQRLRQLAAQRLPESIAKKGKWGFGIPLDRWASGELRDMIRDLLLGPDARTAHVVRREVVVSWIDAFEGLRDIRSDVGRLGLYQRIFMLLSLEIWLREHNPSFT